MNHLRMEPARIQPDDTCHVDILALLHRCFAYMEGRIDPPSSLHQLTVDSIARACSEGEVWAIGKPPIACVFLTQKTNALYLGKLAVDEAHRRSGLAHALVDLAATRAKFRELTTLELESRIELTEVHTAFAKLGFHKLAETAHTGFDRPTSIVMQKAL